MKKIINKLFAKKTAAVSEKNAAQLIKEASVNAALKYAGLKADQVIITSAEFIDSAAGSWYVVTLLDNSTACRMNLTAYVDFYTGEVCGFSGEAEKTWLDYPARLNTDFDCAGADSTPAKAA